MGTLRILLALSVLAGHTSGILGNRLVRTDVAVHLFFVVSGFYMALILTDKYQDRAIFYLNRFLRLWPTYLAVLVAGFAWFYFCWAYTGRQPPPLWVGEAYEAMPTWQALAQYVANFTMVGLEIPYFFFYRPDAGFLFVPFDMPAPADAYRANAFVQVSQAWSISMEIWFYLVAPFLVRRSVVFLTGLAVASAVLNLSADAFGLPTYFFFPAQLYLFVIGILTYRFYASHRAAIDARPLGPVLLFAVTGTVLVYQWLPEAVAPYVLFAVGVPSIPFLFSYFRNTRWDTELGNLSYALYLCHALVNLVFVTAFNLHNGAMVAVASMIVALALYLLIEKPVDKVRQSLARRSQVRRSLGTSGLPESAVVTGAVPSTERSGN
ncbi:MAG: hypothetical protein JWQ58_358 [Reyranella sp.]|nr:hypothetical protein [Reyranella sp.]